MAPREFIRVELIGARELEKSLEQLGKTFTKTILRNAAKKALKRVKQLANERSQTEVGRVTGRYANSFEINTKLSARQQKEAARRGNRGDVNVYVGSTDPKAHLIEWGTSNMDGTPVLRVAWDMEKREVLQIYREELARELMKAARRVRRRAERGTLGKRASQNLIGM